MDSKRETKKFTTSGGHEVVMKTYATGREFNEIQGVYLKDAKLKMIGTQVNIEGFSPTAELEANRKMIEMLVVSLDGTPDNATERVLDLPYKEYQEVVDTLGEVSGKKKTG